MRGSAVEDDFEDWNDLDFTNLNIASSRQFSLPSKTEKLPETRPAVHNKERSANRSTVLGKVSTVIVEPSDPFSASKTLSHGEVDLVADNVSHRSGTQASAYVQGTRETFRKDAGRPQYKIQAQKNMHEKRGITSERQHDLNSNRLRKNDNIVLTQKLQSLSAWQESQAISDHDLSGLELTPALRLHSHDGKGQQSGFAFESDGEDWGEGSLGVRHADAHKSSHRASTGSSNLSISLSSLVESDDGLDGLELPAKLSSLRARLEENSERRAAGDTIKLTTKFPSNTYDDSLEGLVVENANFTKIPILKNPNIKVASPSSRFGVQLSSLRKNSKLMTPSRFQHLPQDAASRNDRLKKAVSRNATQLEVRKLAEPDSYCGIPRPRSLTKMASTNNLPLDSIQREWSTRASQAKITSRQTRIASTKPVFLPGSGSNISSHHVTALNTRFDKLEQQSAGKCNQDDLSHNNRRRATASEALKLQASKISTRTHVRAKTYGEGHELDQMDDIPIDSVRHRRVMPSQRPIHYNMSNAPGHTATRLRQLKDSPISIIDAHPRHFHAGLDTDISSISASTRLGRAPMTPSSRKKRIPRPPALISGVNTTPRRRIEKNMAYNPTTFRWEGNENDEMDRFDAVINSPPRPALIANVNGSKKGIQVVDGMVFDPQQMRWYKLKLGDDDDDDVDPFADLDDFNNSEADHVTQTSPTKAAGVLLSDQFTVGEEFDVGPMFVKKQRASETSWKLTSSMWLRNNDDISHRNTLQEIYDLLLDE